GTQGNNIARQAAIRAGLPVRVPGLTVSRQCASGLEAIATAAYRIMLDGATACVAGGLESLSLAQNEHTNIYYKEDPALRCMKPSIFMTMLQTAEFVAQKYGISRESQDEYALLSQQRTAAAKEHNAFAQEIVPI